MSDNNSKEELREKLHYKLRQKIQEKSLGRKTKVQQKKEIDSVANKMGISEEEMKVISEMVQKTKKNKVKQTK